MEIIDLNSEKELNDFVRQYPNRGGTEFLQAWFWGENAKRLGQTVRRLGVRSSGRLLAVATIIKKPLSAGYSYLYSPRGPLGSPEALAFLISRIKKENPRTVFWRLEPAEAPAGDLSRALRKTIDLQPKQSLLIDLVQPEDTLLTAMHQKTRYNIRLAQKKGLTVEEGKTEDFPEFWRLMSLTGERDGFRLHDAAHYQNLLTGTSPTKLYFARYEGKNIAAGLFCFWGDKVTYLHGASDNEFRQLMAPYFLQWEMIRRAKAAGYKYYDFFGIDEKKWPGVTRFKLGFGGRRVDYPGTFDAVFRPSLYQLYDFLRRIRRGKTPRDNKPDEQEDSIK
jgi:lipid II:glycine glycyltransferase (peptidoglycan interpeptide bridge formation enzyme)